MQASPPRRSSAATFRLVSWLALPLALCALVMRPAAAHADASSADAADAVGQWGPVMNFVVPATHQVLMHNGKVLFWRVGDEARIWDPATGQLTPVPAPFPIPGMNIHCAGQVVLADGRVLVVGGQIDGPHTAIKTTAIFDPATNKWTRVPDMTYERWYPTVTMLSDGRVAVFGGEAANAGGKVSAVEIYDPVANSWSVLQGADRAEDLYSANFLLPDGRIFNATPNSATGKTNTALLNLSTGAWAAGPSADWRTNGYSESFAMYRPGKIIRSGGTPTSLASTNTAHEKAEIIDMTAPGVGGPKWEQTPMAFPRRRHNLVILADGTVMAVGGTRQGDDPAQAVLPAEIFNPDTRAWTTVSAMSQPRMYHSAATLLPDGRVLAAGGEPSTATLASAQTAQVYSPAYLFKGPRPVITAAPTRVGWGATFSVATPDASSISSVALIRPSAVTHANNMDQRYVPLSFTKAGRGLSVTAPASGNWAPPGFYMLVVQSSSGVPSIAKWVQLGQGAVLGNPDLGDDGGSGGGGAGGDAGGGGGQDQGGRQNTARGTVISFPARVSRRTMRVHGLRLGIQVNNALRAARPAMRVRLLKVLSQRGRRVVTTFFRVPRRQGAFRVTLRSPALRRLQPGRYELQVAVGNTRHALRVPAVRRFTVTR